jgi:hypothetical protein
MPWLSAALIAAAIAASASGAERPPIIDVHLHAYPGGEAIPAVANPANGKLPGVKDGGPTFGRASPR